MKAILQGTPVILKIEAFRRPYLTTLMKGVAFMGEEEFYTLLLPFILWICNFRLGSLLAILMALGFYITGILKNSLCLPRPPKPPVNPAAQSQDWAMPSHHSILNVTVPWYIWLYVYIHLDWSFYWLLGAFVCVCLWCFSILLSRLYLSVHSPADILVGGIIGCFLLLLWLQCDIWVSSVLFTKQFVLTFIILCSLLLSCHPDPYPKTIIISETITMVSVAMGVVIGCYFSHVTGIRTTALLEGTIHFSYSVLYQCVLNYIVGIALTFIAKSLLSRVLRYSIQALLSCMGIHYHYIKRDSQVKNEVIHYHPQKFIVLDHVSFPV